MRFCTICAVAFATTTGRWVDQYCFASWPVLVDYSDQYCFAWWPVLVRWATLRRCSYRTTV